VQKAVHRGATGATEVVERATPHGQAAVEAEAPTEKRTGNGGRHVAPPSKLRALGMRCAFVRGRRQSQ
jgi:hypothetical protein